MEHLSSEERMRVFMKAAMRTKIMEILEQDTMPEEDVDWIKKLCEELKSRVAKLTPRRHDLLQQWDTEFDVHLFVQMIRHHAVDAGDANAFVSMIFRRLKMLCAPAQDEALAEAEKMIVEECDTRKKLALLLEISDDILKDIETLLQNVLPSS